MKQKKKILHIIDRITWTPPKTFRCYCGKEFFSLRGQWAHREIEENAEKVTNDS